MSGISVRTGDVPCLILVGGLGTRLRSVIADVPKPMAPVAGKPFLEYLIRWVGRAGFQRVVLCAGYGAGRIKEYFGESDTFGVELSYSVEDEPLGTWGAIRLAGQQIKEAQFLVLNGDSWLQVDLGRLLEFHRQKKGVCTIAAVEVANSSRFGSVHLDVAGRVTKFSEKQREGSSLINGGVYVFSREIFGAIPPTTGSYSLEKEIFPMLIPRGIYAMRVTGYFVDIGVPEEYKRLLQNARGWMKALGLETASEG